MGRLSNKTLALILKHHHLEPPFPPSLHIHEGLERLRELVPNLDNRFRYAIEVRHSSWFQELTYNFFANNDISLAWSQLAGLQTPPLVTTDFLYVRFIGDRSIQATLFKRRPKLLKNNTISNEERISYA